MSFEPLAISMLLGRVAIASAALVHALFATFIVGIALVGAVTATIGHLLRDPRYDRLAHLIAFTLVLITAAVSFLGVTLIFLLNIFWPAFWHRIFHTMFWPFLMEANLFLGEAVFAYAWYYLWGWAWASQPQPAVWRARLHLSFIWLAAGCALVAMFMIDITASYMLTPHPLDAAWANVFNPTMIHLHLHRWFGNITWAGFGLAGLCSVALLRARRRKLPEDVAQYAWGAGYCFLIGFAGLLVMPIIGYQYLLNVRYGQPQAFQTLMLGERSWLFDLVATLYGALVLLGSVYIMGIVRDRAPSVSSGRLFLPLSLAILLFAVVVFAQPYHLQHIPFVSQLTDRQINPLGKMQPYKYFAIALLLTFGVFNLIYGLRWFRQTSNRPAWFSPYLLIALATCTILIMLTMGWVRESARAANGYLLYGAISLEDERPTYDGNGDVQADQ